MPGRDRRGPVGSGPMTGKGLGYCAEKAAAIAGARMGRGGGMRRRYGAGLGRGFAGNSGRFDPVQPMGFQEEKDLLRMEEEQLSRNLEDIRARLSKLEVEK